jgi:RsiW-degrading membrane proteinase PrsW (M82 family)
VTFFTELWAFLRSRKKQWLLPVLIVMALLGGILIFSQGSVIAPFIYTLF